MNYYLKKRLSKNIARSDMANMLGINYDRYLAIEKGSVKMPLKLIEKFNEIINKGKENDITKVENTIKADEFWNEVSQKNEEDKYILIDKMHEFNIPNVKTLVHLLGYKSEGTIWNYLQGRNPAGVEFKKRLYNFFSNELNVQIPTKVIGKTITGKRRLREPAVNKELDRYYEKTNFRKLLSEYHITNRTIAKAVGTHDSTISEMTRKKRKPSYKVIQAVKDYLDNIINEANKTEVVSEYKAVNTTCNTENKEEYISKQVLIEQCTKEINANNTKIEELNSQIKELESKNEISFKFIALVKSLQ